MALASERTTGLALPYFSASTKRRPGPVKANTAGTADVHGAGRAATAQHAHGAGPGRRQAGHWVGRSTPLV